VIRRSTLASSYITRELPRGFVIEAAYTGRFAHRLLQEEDLAQPLDIRDPQSGMDYFSAATMFTRAAEARVPIQNVAPIPFWEHLFPMAAGLGKLPAPPCQFAGIAPPNPTATENMYGLFSCWVPQRDGSSLFCGHSVFSGLCHDQWHDGALPVFRLAVCFPVRLADYWH